MFERLERDLKTALLSGDKTKVEILKGLKNALLYEAVSHKSKPEMLSEEQMQSVFMRESKKRLDTAEIYKNAGEQARAEIELSEKAVIDSYLPEKLDETQIKKAIEAEITKLGAASISDMGKIISSVKAKIGAQAEGAVIARITRQLLEKK